MATVTLRLDDQTRDNVDELARERGISVSELLRSAIADFIESGRSAEAPRTLTLMERRTLALQHDILAQVRADDKDEVAYHRKRAEVLSQGFTGEYETEFLSIEPELSLQECSLVWRLLDMFRHLKNGLERLSPEDRATLDDTGQHALLALTFRGFDFNDAREARLASYAEYLIDDKRWEELAVHFDDQHERGNSHMPYLVTYQRMLNAFTPRWEKRTSNSSLGFPDRYILDLNDLQAVCAAWAAPRP
jgi:uncharacterized protein YfbU (UPF0304 family)